MILRNIAAAAAIMVLAACGSKEEPAAHEQAESVDPVVALHALFDEHFERELELNPLRATFIGDNRFNARLAHSYSAEHRAAEEAMDREFLERLLEIDRGQLGYQDQLSYDIFRFDREESLEGNQYPTHLQPLNQFRSMMNFFVQLGSGASAHPFKTVEDYEDWLSRVDDFVINVDQMIANMKEGMQQGIVQPRILMAKVVPQLESQLKDDVTQSAFYKPISYLPEDFSDADRDRLTAAFEDKIADAIIPAYARLNNFLGDEYLAAGRDTVGLYALPNGENWYAYNVRRITTTDMTPDEIHQIGLDEVARIHAEMHSVMEAVGFDGDLKEFFEYVNTDPQFYFDEPEQLIQGYRDMADHVNELAKNLFEIFPKTDFEVRRVEPFREQSASGGSYMAGTPDGSRPGVFYANAYDLSARPNWAMESLYLHEAIPGHHFQIMIQRENEDLPDFRRFGGFTAFSEGWGLYAESLGKEIGVYTDPYQYFGGLNAELWRAIRLVVDTGIHAKGWSRQQVLDYMYANSAVAEARAVSEAERFMAIPGQALAYKVGQLKIRAIRDKAEERLGDSFDVKAFHTQVLKDGAMPLSMLEAKIDRWVDSQLQ
ncbi:MAG: DUF885 domain-containing protein [Gammaproteobacteria bacterium]|nr:DUF885 domain-containing protein [Gammaproteobacteria bacterium]MBT8105810.1 DUF885 domain-containing protein [Gammaproteobacteria bacterium]NNF49553.1 DUF885 domain-containing protein [Woeseiaceae bacterium]NNK25824.1 DUF885 domain-containing protein [Woeseiaceae bacterium]NNL62659.1 DUF885 domain-containing protein [Woeseiaceae bacterium]